MVLTKGDIRMIIKKDTRSTRPLTSNRARRPYFTEVYDLHPEYDGRKSFYHKARIDTGHDNTSNVLWSYNTKVAEMIDGRPVVYGTYSPTTLRHIKEWLRQNGYRADSAKQILRDYAPDFD